MVLIMNDGWISLYRKMFDWDWYLDSNTKSLFIHLLLKANRIDNNYQGEIIKRGQHKTGLFKLAAETGLSIQQLRTSLKKLEKTNDITSKSTNKYRIITVVKYNDYQDTNKQNNKRVTIKQQTSNKQVTTNNKDNKLNKENKVIKDTKKIIPKLKYLEFVLLTEDEHTKLKEKFNSRLDSQIENLNNYIGSTGKKYKSHYHTLLSWDRKNSNDNKETIPTNRYDDVEMKFEE